jgi:hypothetical protein
MQYEGENKRPGGTKEGGRHERESGLNTVEDAWNEDDLVT